jgi:cell division protein FtsB
VSRRVYAHSKSAKAAPKPFRPAKESPSAARPARAKAIKVTKATKATRPAKATDTAKAARVKATAIRPKTTTGKVSKAAKVTKSKVTKPKATKSKVTKPKVTKPKAVTSGKGPKTANGPRPSRLTTLGRPKALRGPKRTAADKKPSGAQRSPAGKRRSTKSTTRASKHPTSALTRRNRIPVAVAAVFAVVVLAAGFPLSSLFTQRHQLSAAGAELSQLQHSNKLLAEQQQQLNSKVEINRLARQDYQLVSPGQTLYEVLPPSGTGSTVLPGGAPSGDPGIQPLVSPSHAPDMSPDPGLPQAPSTVDPSTVAKSGSAGSAAPTSPSTFWGRVSNTLQFWK